MVGGRVSLLLPLLCLLCVGPWSVEAQFNITVSPNGTFSEALYNVTLEIPDFWFLFEVGVVTNNVTVTNLTCTHLTIEGLTGRFVPLKESLRPSSKELLGSNFTAYGVVVQCHSLWSYPGTFGTNSGDMNLTIADDSSLSLLLSLSELQTPSPSPSPSWSSSSSPSASSSSSSSASMIPPSSSASPSPSASRSMSASPSSSSSISSAISPSMSASETATSTNTQSTSSTSSPSTSASISGSRTASSSMSSSGSMSPSLASQFQVAFAKALEAQQPMPAVVPEGDVAPTFVMSVVNCSMHAVVTYVHTSDDTLNKLRRNLETTLEGLIPGLVCEQSQTIVDTVLNPIINDLAENIWNATTSLQNGAPDEIWSEEAFFYSFVGATAFFLLLFFVLCLAPNAYLLYRDYANRDNPEYQQEKQPLTGDDEQPAISGMKAMTEERPYNGWNAMIIDPRLAWYWRFGLMLVILYNVALFATSTVSIASSVYVYLSVGDNIRQLPSLYSFNIITSVIEMWQAPGVWPLSLLIGVASGIWPYVKLIFMFLCMITPPRLLPVVWRKRLLRLLDILGKWSLIDVYVLVFFIEAFRVHIPLSERMAFDMAVEAQYAFFAYLFATILSLGLTHVMLFVHDNLEEVQPRDGGRIEQLASHSFGMRRLVATPLGKYLIPLLVLITMALTLIGSGVTAFKLDWSGSLVGNLMLNINGENTRDYSVFSLLGSVPQTSFDDPNGPRVRTIQLAATSFVLVIPCLHLVSLMAVWLLPLSVKLQKNFWYVIEILYAWAAMEVFIVALVVALLELGDFAAFIISGKCILVDELIQRFSNTPQPCFAVHAELEAGSALLVVAVLILLVVTLIIMCVFNRAVHERTEQFHYHRMYIADAEEPVSHSRQSSPAASAFGTLTYNLKLTKIE